MKWRELSRSPIVQGMAVGLIAGFVLGLGAVSLEPSWPGLGLVAKLASAGFWVAAVVGFVVWALTGPGPLPPEAADYDDDTPPKP